MSLWKRRVGLLGSVIVGLGISTVGAQQHVMPTGTPTWAPRPTAATPVPLTPLQKRAKELGEKLGAIDLGVWETVEKEWKDPEACYEAVDARLAAAEKTVRTLILENDVINCVYQEGSGVRRVHLKSDEARKGFLLGYHDAIAALRALKKEFEDTPEAMEVLKEVRVRQRTWQRNICKALESVKPPDVIPAPTPISTEKTAAPF